MNNTYISNVLFEEKDNKAKGYDHLNELYDYNLKTYGAGGVYSTIIDLYKWHLHLTNQTELSDFLMSLMYSPTRLKDGRIIQIGYGWGILKKVPGFVTTNGEYMGFRSTMIRCINNDTMIVALTNKTCEQTEKICFEIMDILNGLNIKSPLPPKETIETNVSADILKIYCGEYDFNGYIIDISLLNEKLIYKEPGMRENTLYAESELKFFMKSFNILCEFEEVNEMLYLIINNNGTIHKGHKIK